MTSLPLAALLKGGITTVNLTTAAVAATQAALRAMGSAVDAAAHRDTHTSAAATPTLSVVNLTKYLTASSSSKTLMSPLIRTGRALRVFAATMPAPAVICNSNGWHTLHTSPMTANSASPTDLVAKVVLAAQSGVKDSDLLMSLARSAGAHAASGQLSPAQIRDLCVSFADLGFFDVGFKSAMAEAIIPRLSTFEPAMLADTMQAYGMAQYYDYELMSEAVSYLKANADRFDATGLAKDEALMAVMHDVAEKLASSCDSTSLADVVYAEAQMGWADQRLAELVADYATANIESFDAPSLTRLLAGLASVGYDDSDLADAAGRHACAMLDSGEMTPHQLVPLLWAYGQQGHYHAGLMAHAEAMLNREDTLASLSTDELHILIDACNSLGMHGPGISAAASRLGRMVPTIQAGNAE